MRSPAKKVLRPAPGASALRRGFSLAETLIVIAIIGVIAVFVAPFLYSSLSGNDLAASAAGAVDALREAQSATMSGKDNARFGGHFEAGTYVLFEGATYSASSATNVVHALSGQVSITSVALAPGGTCTPSTASGNCDVHFADHRGVPTENGTVVFTGPSATKTLTVGAAGAVDAN